MTEVVEEPRVPKLPSRLSPSAADTWTNCPKKWWGKYVYGINEPPGPAAEMGTLVHAALEGLYNLPVGERTREKARELIRAHAKKMTEEGAFTEAEDMVDFFREAWARLIVIWNLEDPDKVEVIATEQKLHTTVGGVPFTGYIDRLEVVDGKVTVGDYKTGKRPSPMFKEPKERQIQLYVAAVNEAMDVKAERGRLIWLNATGAIWDVDSSPRAVGETVRYFQNVWEEMSYAVEHDEWPARPNGLCGWCPVLPLCEEGQAHVRAQAAAGKLKDTAPAWSIREYWQG